MALSLSGPSLSFGAKYDTAGSRALASSGGRSWRGIHAEIRHHNRIDAEPFVQPVTEVVIVVRGAANVDRRGDSRTQLFDAHPGSFCICPEGVPVEYLRMRSDGIQLIHLYLPAGDRSFASWEYAGGLIDPLVSQIGMAIAEELQSESAGGDLLLDALRTALIARIAHRYQRLKCEEPTSRAHGLDPKRLARVMEFLSNNLESSLSLSDIANAACLSRSHFVRAFKVATGTTPYQYLSELRLEHARRLLDSGGDTIDNIAYRLQFSNSANFSRAFRRQVGVSPSAFRNMAMPLTDPAPAAAVHHSVPPPSVAPSLSRG